MISGALAKSHDISDGAGPVVAVAACLHGSIIESGARQLLQAILHGAPTPKVVCMLLLHVNDHSATTLRWI